VRELVSKGTRVLVTGAQQDIGNATAIAFARSAASPARRWRMAQ